MCKPFCRGSSLKVLSKKHNKGLNVRTFICDDCSTLWIVERMPFINNHGVQEDIITVTYQTGSSPEIVKRGGLVQRQRQKI